MNGKEIINQLKPQLRQAYYILRQVQREFARDRCTREANAMAYRTLFSSVPVLAVFLGVFTFFGPITDFRDRILTTLYSFLVPAAGDIIRQYMMQFAENTKTLGMVGIVGTFIVAIYLFWAIERSFNHIWGVSQKRGFVRNFTAFTAILLWAPILIGLSFYFTGKLHGYVPRFFGREEVSIYGWLSLRVLPILFSFLGLTIIYIVVPNTRVNVRAAAIGALVTAAGWELVKVGFNFYVANAMKYDKVYGSLAVVPIFIIGLYLLWLVVFMGAELAYVLHNYRYNESWDRKELSLLKPYMAVGLMLELGRRFYAGEKPAIIEELSRKFRVSIPILRDVFTNLLREGLVVQSDEDTYFPAKSLQLITLKEAFAAGLDEVAAIEKFNENPLAMLKGLPASMVMELQKALMGIAETHQRMLGAIVLTDLLVSGPEPEAGTVACAGFLFRDHDLRLI